MKKIVLLLVLFSLLGCEKDDICDPTTSTTPRLVIEFYDNNVVPSQTLKPVTKLLVGGFGLQYAYAQYTGVSKIKIPLKIESNETKYNFILNPGDTANENSDLLTFNYDKNKIFVSRACGYKVNFNLTNSNSTILTNDLSNWIKAISITKSTIDNENETHIKIYY
ncbi:MAG: hypothetical protein H7239_07345 [Flavobacterium sp.]|nr:hypothetical protein [Flavobacterium sp.]